MNMYYLSVLCLDSEEIKGSLNHLGRSVMQKLRGLDLVGTSVDGALIALKGNKVVREECLYAARPARRPS